MARTLVVARHKEDTSWTKSIPSDWDVFVVQKDLHLPNQGREGASFLWFIIDRYDAASHADEFVFVQGKPFDHIGDLRLDRLFTGYVPLGDLHLTCGPHGEPHHPGLPVQARFEKWIERPWPGKVPFVSGGQFAIDGARMKLRSKTYYQMIFDYVMTNREGPWLLERMWSSIFSLS